MTDLLVTAELPLTGADAGDKVVNNFVFHSPDAYTPGDATDLMGEVADFYKNIPTGGFQKPAYYLANSIDRGADMCVLKTYDITGKLGNRGPDVNGKEQGPAPHGSPIALQTFTMDGAGGTSDLPPQVALCITLRARSAWTYPVEAPDAGDPGSAIDRPRARRSGRLYIGPFITTNTNGATGRPIAGLRDDLLRSCEDLQDAQAVHGYAWCVWSRQNAAVSVIERVEIDDSWDTIRSRKRVAAVRDLRTFAPVPDVALGA